MPATVAGSSGEQQQEAACVVRHVLSVKPMMDVPPPIATYTRGIFVQQVRVLVSCVVCEWESE